jgi:ABC-type nitrate/sulfonate/bicarbonate transport system permease component
LKEKTKLTIISIISLAVFFLMWQLLTGTFHLIPEKKLPSPLKLLNTFVYKLSHTNPDGGVLFVHIWTSLKETLLGFLLGIGIGVPIGICMAWFKRVDLFFKPLFDLIKPIPPVGWVPVMLALFGLGIMSKISVIFIASVMPAIVNAYSGIKQTKSVHLWVAQTFGAKRRQMLFTVAIPTAGPMIFTGIRVALNGSWLSLVAAELIASTKGLGYMIQTARLVGRIDVVFVGVLVIGMFGALLAFLVGFAEKKLVRGGR